jgi:CheY-like chemotaxis protein
MGGREIDPRVSVPEIVASASQPGAFPDALGTSKLAMNIIEMHGGMVEARSPRMDQGADLMVTSPAAEPGRSSAAQPMRAQEGKPPRWRVLVVDDTRPAAFLLGKLLEALGQDVEICYDAASALDAARKSKPDFIFSDIVMPHMDGYQLARQLRSDEMLRDVTLVALTGYGHESDRLKSEEAGFHHHLVKPVSVATLQALFQDG